jgi:hypothetical protein
MHRGEEERQPGLPEGRGEPAVEMVIEDVVAGPSDGQDAGRGPPHHDAVGGVDDGTRGAEVRGEGSDDGILIGEHEEVAFGLHTPCQSRNPLTVRTPGGGAFGAGIRSPPAMAKALGTSHGMFSDALRLLVLGGVLSVERTMAAGPDGPAGCASNPRA